MKTRGSITLRWLAAVVAAGALMAPAVHADPTGNKLRVCADPDNLPFSKSEGPERGMYVELAELVGKKLNQPVEYVWWLTFYQRRALRNTIQADTCDAVFALPADAEYRLRGLQRSQPFLWVGYAAVGPQSLEFRGLADLKGKRVAVQFGSTPQVVLAGIEGLNISTFKTSDEVFAALAKGEVDVGFLWGPIAGYENQRQHANRWRLTPVQGQGLGGEVAVAVRRDKGTLAADIDKALGELRPEIQRLAAKYGFPNAAPVPLTSASAPTSKAGTPNAYAQQTARPNAGAVRVPASMVKSVAGPSGGTLPSDPIQAGRVRFNDVCSHCHGTDGASPIRERDLRRLKLRYDDKWRETASTTVNNGRLPQGMPAWKDVLPAKEIDQVMGFLATIQR